MTLSRFPIVYEQFFPFPRVENMNVVERVAKKGFLVSEIIRNGKSIFVINTHLYAGLSNNAESIRLQQIDFLQRTLNSIVPADGIVLMAGDINSNPRNIELSQDLPKEFVHNYIMEEMDFIDPGYQESSELCTIQSGVNAYQTEKEPKQKLDYIFYRCEKQGTSLQTINHRLLFKNEESISDHLALGVELLICETSE